MPRAVHRCAGGSDDCGPRPDTSGVTVQDTPRSPARGWLRGREWERITRGVYAAALSRTQFEELAAWQLVLPRTAAFSHLTRRSAPGMVAAGHHRPPGLRCHAQRRSPSPAALGCWYAATPSRSR